MRLSFSFSFERDQGVHSMHMHSNKNVKKLIRKLHIKYILYDKDSCTDSENYVLIYREYNI